mgnify:CR=1 FL=1
MVNKTFLKISLLLVELTSIPLLILMSIYIITAYGMLNPKFIGLITSLNYVISLRIHTDSLLRITCVILTMTHSYGGLTLLITRRVRNRKIASTIIMLMTLIIATLTSIYLIAEATK